MRSVNKSRRCFCLFLLEEVTHTVTTPSFTTLLSAARTVLQAGAKLVVMNLSNQSDSSDLLGGFRPMQPGLALVPLAAQFDQLMRETWPQGKNEAFLARVHKFVRGRLWPKLLKAFDVALLKVRALVNTALIKSLRCKVLSSTLHCFMSVVEQEVDVPLPEVPLLLHALLRCACFRHDAKHKAIFSLLRGEQLGRGEGEVPKAPGVQVKAAGEAPPTKKSRLAAEALPARWAAFADAAATAERALTVAKAGFAFHFLEGALVTALREGHWILLDEINLAPPQVLERVMGLLEGGSGGLVLLERGDSEPVPQHKAFRLFGAMNPATDAGKRHLSKQIRAHFTELYVTEPDDDADLVRPEKLAHFPGVSIVSSAGLSGSATAAIMPVRVSSKG